MNLKLSILVLVLFATVAVFCGTPPLKTSMRNGRMICQGKPLPGRVLRSLGNYAVTSEGVFFRCSRIPNINPFTFFFLDYSYAYDNSNIYFNGEIVRGVNYDFAEPIDCDLVPNVPRSRRGPRSCLQDNVNYFYNGQVWLNW